MKSHSKSQRAARFWSRLVGWYGTRLTEQYGQDPPEDWCDVVDAAENETVKLVLSQIREKHAVYPPTFPEVDAMFSRSCRPSAVYEGPTAMQRLCDFVLAYRPLTVTQRRLPWPYLARFVDAPGIDGKMRHNHGVEIVGVIIPADGEFPGYRVLLEDLQAESGA